jgi:hypothetical protein
MPEPRLLVLTIARTAPLATAGSSARDFQVLPQGEAIS